MASNPKKVAVLEALAKVREPIGLPALLEMLPPDFAERSVRRWLGELAKEGLVIRSGQKRSTRYQLNLSQQVEPGQEGESVFNQVAQEAIAYVRQPLFKRQPVSYNREWFESYRPNRSSYFSKGEMEALTQSGQRASAREPAGTYARRIYNRLLIDLSYNSSRLEGNTYSLIDTERLLVEGRSAEGKLDEEMVMILNHKEAIRHLVEEVPRVEISYNEICTLHYLLSDGLVPPRYSGKIRDHGVRVGASTYVPLEGPQVLERQLRTIADRAAAIRNPHEQSLFLLVHVAYLQAFTDVNKRTARLSANIPLLLNNLVPLSFNSIGKDDYASAMIAVYELNDVRPLVDLYRTSYLHGCQEYDATTEAMGFDEIRVRYREQRRQVIREVIANRLTGEAQHAHIAEVATQLIPDGDRDGFIEDVMEDLEEISPQRIAGLGITRQQLELWLQSRQRE